MSEPENFPGQAPTASRDTGMEERAAEFDTGTDETAASRDTGMAPPTASRDTGMEEPAASRDTGMEPPTASRDTGMEEPNSGRHAGSGPSGGQAGAGPDSEAGTGRMPLLEADELKAVIDRWRGIQAEFVDEPRRAVQEADALVSDLMSRLARTFVAEREQLEARLGGSDDVSTEDLRQGLQRYRSFFERLLAA